MLLAAVDEDLGALFFGIPPALVGRFREQYGVPERYRPIGAVAVGLPTPPPTRAARHASSVAVPWMTWCIAATGRAPQTRPDRGG